MTGGAGSPHPAPAMRIGLVGLGRMGANMAENHPVGFRFVVQAREKGAILSFGIDGIHPHDIATIIDQSGVAVRSGQHCAEPLMRHLGVTATARASFALYNTIEEVDILVRALENCRKLFG